MFCRQFRAESILKRIWMARAIVTVLAVINPVLCGSILR
jgi:hypothetical protein